jgi:menaquinone-dependent protoporphyrinogen oxidase
MEYNPHFSEKHGTYTCRICNEKGIHCRDRTGIAKELQAAGHTADAVEIAKGASPAGYDAVVIGGPMYVGKIDGMGKFVKRHTMELARVPVGGFVVCLAAAAKDPEGLAWAEKVLHAAFEPLRPVAEMIFAGRLDPSKLSWLQKWVTEKTKSPVGDFRDWTAIAAWARELPGKMKV